MSSILCACAVQAHSSVHNACMVAVTPQDCLLWAISAFPAGSEIKCRALQAHSSVRKACMVAVTPHVRVLPTREDNAFSIEPALLEAAIKEDLAAGEGHAGQHQSLRCAQSLTFLRQILVPFQPASPQLAMKVTSACIQAAQPRDQLAAALVKANLQAGAALSMLLLVCTVPAQFDTWCNAGLRPFYMLGIFGTTPSLCPASRLLLHEAK